LKFQAVAEKTAKDARGLLYFAAPGILQCRSAHFNTQNSQYSISNKLQSAYTILSIIRWPYIIAFSNFIYNSFREPSPLSLHFNGHFSR